MTCALLASANAASAGTSASALARVAAAASNRVERAEPLLAAGVQAHALLQVDLADHEQRGEQVKIVAGATGGVLTIAASRAHIGELLEHLHC